MPDEKAVPPEGSSVEPNEEQKKQKETDEEASDEKKEEGKNYRLMDTLAFDTETLKKIIQQQKDEKKDK